MDAVDIAVGQACPRGCLPTCRKAGARLNGVVSLRMIPLPVQALGHEQGKYGDAGA